MFVTFGRNKKQVAPHSNRCSAMESVTTAPRRDSWRLLRSNYHSKAHETIDKVDWLRTFDRKDANGRPLSREKDQI